VSVLYSYETRLSKGLDSKHYSLKFSHFYGNLASHHHDTRNCVRSRRNCLCYSFCSYLLCGKVNLDIENPPGYTNLGDSAGTLDEGNNSRTISITTQADVSSNYKTRILIVIGSLTAFLSSVFVLGLIIANLDSLPQAEGWIFVSGWVRGEDE